MSISCGLGVLLFCGSVDWVAAERREDDPWLLAGLCALLDVAWFFLTSSIGGGMGLRPSICTHSKPACSSSDIKDMTSLHSDPSFCFPRIMTIISPCRSPFRAEALLSWTGGRSNQRPVGSTSQNSMSPPTPVPGALSRSRSSTRQLIS